MVSGFGVCADAIVGRRRKLLSCSRTTWIDLLLLLPPELPESSPGVLVGAARLVLSTWAMVHSRSNG